MSVRLGKVATAPADSPAAPVRGGIAIQEFLDQLDVPKQILQYLTKNVRDRVLSEADLMIELRVNPTAFRRAVMNPSFDPYRLKVKDKVFWSIPANIEKAKRLINQ